MDALPELMTAMAIPTPGGPEALIPEQRRVPAPGLGEILIKVKAAGVNRPDILQRQGHYPAPPGASDIPGLEIAGQVVGSGLGATRYKLGDKVMALVPGGGYAQYCTVHESCALPVPASLTLTEAACVPETFFTVWHNVFQRGALKPGETLLVHGGASGIGTTSIQLAKAFNSTILVTAGSKEKCDACIKLGADHAINYTTEDFVREAKSFTNGVGVNVILDMVGGDYIERNWDAAALEGRIVTIASKPSATVNFQRLMIKRLTHTGSTLKIRTVEVKAGIAREVEDKVLPLICSGKIRPVIDSTFPLQKASEAHARMESSLHFGKIALLTEPS